MAKEKKSKRGGLVTLILLAGGALAAGYFWVKHQLRFIQVGNPSIPFQQLQSGAINLGISLPIINSSSLSIPITRFSGYIKSPSGSILGPVTMEQGATIQPASEGALKFKARIRLTDLAVEIYNIITGGGQPNWKGYIIEGQAWVYGVPLPINTSIF